MAARRDDLGLEPVRGDEPREVIDEVEADRLDAARRAGHGLLGGEPLPDGGALVLAAVGEDAVEDLVEGLPDDLQLGQPALVEDGHRRLVAHRLLDGVGVDVGAERAQGAAVLLVDGGAGEAEEAGVGQCLPHVGSEAPVLRAVGLVDHHEDVGGLGQGRMDRPPTRRGSRAGDLLELLDRRHHRPARRVLQDVPQVAHAAGPLGVREAARLEHPGDLPVELGAVGDDDHRRLLVRLVAAQLQGQPQHGQALARPLGVPDHAAPRARPPRRPDAPHRLVHGDELPVARQLADGAAALHLEHHEVAHDVEEVAGLEQPVEQDVLPRRGAPEPVAELRHGQGIRLLPFQEEPLGRPHRAVDSALAAGADENLRRLEQPRRALVLPARVGLLVAAELLHRLGLPGVADGGALALDDREGQAVHEGDDVGDDVLLRPEHPVLAGDDPLVPLGVDEVEEPDGVALAPAAPVLLERDAVGERRVERLVRLGEAGRGHLRYRLHRLGDVRVGQPGVQPLEGRGEAAGEDGLLEARALGLEGLGRDAAVAERLQQLDGGVLREVQLVPAGRTGRHG